jgi:hypothetical protein
MTVRMILPDMDAGRTLPHPRVADFPGKAMAIMPETIRMAMMPGRCHGVIC